MIVTKLDNYPPWQYRPPYSSPILEPGDTRISLSGVTPASKQGLEQLMDAILVRNDILPQNLHLSHDETEARPFLLAFHRTITISKPGLKKTRVDDPAGGYTVLYESGRSGNPYEAIRQPSDYYLAKIIVGPIQVLGLTNKSPSGVGPIGATKEDEVNIFVHLHRTKYGEMLIKEIIERFNPEFSDELKERKKTKGRHERTSITECAP